MKRTLVSILTGLLVFAAIASAQTPPAAKAKPRTKSRPQVDAAVPSPPLQPDSGPGGREYVHQQIIASVHGQGDDEYWLFEPDGPKPPSAPLIVFLHGFGATNPNIYGAWIRHLVLRGNIVVYPRYQENVRTPPDQYTINVLRAVRLAIERMQAGGHVKPRVDQFAIVGHSVGGILAANVAAKAVPSLLPLPRAVMVIQPGLTQPNAVFAGVPLEDLSQIPAQTLLLVIVGEDDRIVGEADAKRIFKQATSLESRNKNYIRMRTDARGAPPLEADHQSPAALARLVDDPAAPQPIIGNADEAGRPLVARQLARRFFDGLADYSVNALDYYGYWKLTDALCEAAFTGKRRDFALGNTVNQKAMGRWSDGTAVKELLIVEQP